MDSLRWVAWWACLFSLVVSVGPFYSLSLQPVCRKEKWPLQLGVFGGNSNAKQNTLLPCFCPFSLFPSPHAFSPQIWVTSHCILANRMSNSFLSMIGFLLGPQGLLSLGNVTLTILVSSVGFVSFRRPRALSSSFIFLNGIHSFYFCDLLGI